MYVQAQGYSHSRQPHAGGGLTKSTVDHGVRESHLLDPVNQVVAHDLVPLAVRDVEHCQIRYAQHAIFEQNGLSDILGKL